MFDRTITLKSTDGTVQLAMTAGTEGIKSMVLSTPGKITMVTEQELIDVIAPFLKEWAASQSAGDSSSS